MQFDYFYGNESEQFTFYRIPKVLVSSPQFRKVSDSAKLLYGLMLDRMSLSIKNGWFDEQNRAYIYFTVKDIMEYMCCATEKATKITAELDSVKGIGLIERVKPGQGKPARIYVKKFLPDYMETYQKPRASEIEKQDFPKPKSQTFENRKSRVSTAEIQDFRESKCNYNNIKDNEFNNTDLSNINPINRSECVTDDTEPQHYKTERLIDRYNKTVAQIKKQIEYDSLISTNDAEIINNIVNVMADVMLIDIPSYEIEGNIISTELVQIRYSQITYGSLDAFLIEFSKIYYKIKNPKAYLTTALYNVALTAGAALTNRVNHDMYGEGD